MSTDSLLKEMNNLFQTDFGIHYSCNPASMHADYENNQIYFCEDLCEKKTKSCLLILAHEFAHLLTDIPIKDSYPDDSGMCDKPGAYYNDYPTGEYSSFDVAQIKHQNTTIIGLKILLKLGYDYSDSDINATFDMTKKMLEVRSFSNDLKRPLLHYSEVGRGLLLKSLEEGLSANNHYIPIGVINNPKRLAKGFKGSELTSFLLRTKDAGRCSYFPYKDSVEIINKLYFK